MEIKHTVEILTKDIQEIEKLVRNLNNSPIPPRIELDLALSKLRNVYELLSMICADAEKEISPEKAVDEAVYEKPALEVEIAVTPEPESIAEVEIAVTPEPESIAEEELAETKIPTEETGVVNESLESMVVTPEPVHQVSSTQTEQEIEKHAPEPLKKKKEAVILAEKFNHDTSINDNIASAAKKENVTSKISGQAIENIGRNIGINDRFLIIRELFDGNNDNYNQLIKELDSSANAEDAFGILESTFPDDSEHDGYQLLAQLTRRKFI